MKFLSWIVLMLLYVSAAYAQTPKIDSLNRLISQAKSDSARFRLIDTKASLLSQINLDSAVNLSLRTIDEAKRAKYPKGEAMARIRLANNYTFKGNYAAAKQNLEQAESIYTTIKDEKGLTDTYNAYGMMYGMQSKYDSSIKALEKGIEISERTQYKAKLFGLYLNVGISYDMLSNQLRGLQYKQKALKLAEGTNDLTNQAYALVNIANTYDVMGDKKRAEQSYLRAIRIAEQENLKNVELYSYANLADSYLDLNANQKAYEAATKAVNLSKETGDNGMEAATLAKAARSLAKQNNYTQAEELGKQAIVLADKAQQPINIHQANAAMGLIMKMQKKYAQAIPFYETGFAALKNADVYETQIGQAYKDLSECYEQTGNYRGALVSFKKATAISDSVFNKEKVRKATELAMTYDFEKKQQLEKAEQQKQEAIARARQLALLAGLALMLLLASVSFYAYRTKKKANTLLEEQKLQLQDQKRMLEQQKLQLETTLAELRATQRQLLQAEKMATMGKLTKGIVDRIQNPLNYINNFALGANELLDELKTVIDKNPTCLPRNDQEELEDVANMLVQNLKKINEHGSSTSRILQDMQKLLKERSSMATTTDINPFLEKQVTTSLQKVSADNSGAVPVELVFDLASHPMEVSLLPQEFSQVVTNLIDNSYYSLQDKSRRITGFAPQISVTTQIEDDHVRIVIRDNGRGIGAKEQEQLFSPFFTTKPTAKGTGLGLYMSRDIVEYMQGNMSLESKEGEYVQVTITLPLVSSESLV